MKSVFLLSAGSFAHLVVQFVLLKVLAALFGTGAEIDAYSAARAVPLVASTVLVGSLNFAFVPIFIERREKQGRRAAWETAGAVGGLLLLVTVLLAATGCAAARPIVSQLNPGFRGDQLALAVGLFRILIWLTVTNGAISFLQALHHCEQRFTLPAITPALGGSVAVAVTLMWHGKLGIAAAAYGVLAGAVLAAALQFPLFFRNARFRLTSDEGLARILRLMAPLVAGAVYCKLDPLVDRYLSSRMETGSIAILEYSWQFTNAMLILASSGLAIVVFPVIARHSSTGDRAGLKGELAYAMRFLAFVLTPVVVGLALFATPVISDLLQGGKFQAADTAAVSRLLKIYTLVIVGGSFGEMLSRVFYALQDTRTPVLIAVVGFTLGAAGKFLIAPQRGVDGIAAVTSAYYLFNAGCMLWILRGRLQGIGFAGVLRTVRDSCAGTVVACGVAFGVIAIGFRFAAIPAAVAAAATYAGVMWLLGNEFAARLFAYFSGRGGTTLMQGDSGEADESNV